MMFCGKSGNIEDGYGWSVFIWWVKNVVEFWGFLSYDGEFLWNIDIIAHF